MPLPNLSDITANAESIVRGIGQEAVDVYRFLSEEFARGSVSENCVFQFTYRSFYRLDSAGLTTEFKNRYFLLMEQARETPEVDLPELTRDLFTIRNRKGNQSLQFSFVTKLANTVNREYPIYDAEVASVFGFRAPYCYKAFDTRLNEYMAFHGRLRRAYADILDRNLLDEPRRLFREIYGAPHGGIPDIKLLDFIFWSAGKTPFQR